jgi:amino acid adenylation domain-containing protein
MLPLSQGATVVIATQDERLDPLALFRLMKRHGVTVFDAVPSFQRHCTNTLLDLQPELRAELLENRVRLILSASEPLLSDVPQIWRQQFRHPAHHVHMFGQTETSGIVALHHLTDEDCAQIKVVPVGRPLARTQIYLLDENQQPVPDGEPGEICVSSAGLARGYLNRPELTAQKFIEWAVKDAPGHQPLTTNHSRLCRTGDFARRLPDGKLECLGRQDSQLKLRGFRIEPGEIEAVLAQHPDVRECVVAARQDQHGQPRLVAWVVPRRGSSVVSELRQMAQEQLPDYLRPAAFVPLAALPLTPNGKVDRRALPEPDESAFVTEQPYAAPRTETERLVAEIWAAVLGLRRVGIHDHFFELGGHSLLAGRVINRIRKTFQSEIPLRALFEAPTVAEFAARLEQALQDASAPQAPPLRRADRPAELPLSFAQQRLWFLAQLEPGTATYNLRRVVRISGQLNVEALRRAVQAIVRRHEILRTNFISIDGRPLQLIAPDFTADLPVSDLSHLPAAQRVAEAQRLAAAISARPFDLASDPLLRVELLRLSDEDHFLVTVFHHIISDGWSLGIFFRELGAFYRADIEGQDAALPALPVQYADYVLWEQETLREERTAELTAFWREQLSGAPARLELPTDHPRPPVQRYRGAQLSAQLSPQLSSELRALSQREGVTLFMTLLAAFQTLLHRYAQQEQILIGTPTAGRLALETEALIGFFVNTLVLRGDLSGEPTFRELLGRTRQRVLGALAHQELPFEKLVEELQPQRSLSYSPLFQVMFALQNTPAADQTGLQLSPVRLSGTTARFDLSLDVFEERDGLRLQLEYDTDLFETDTAARLLGHLETLLAAVVVNPDERLSALPLLSERERHELLTGFNERRVPVPSACLHHLIEAQAAASPDAIAVVCGAERLTYGALNARANQLARYLLKAGAGPEAIVGICVERSPEMIVSLLGVLKAGAAYLPLDPNYPAERLKHMLSDAAAPIVLTQEHLTSHISHLKSDTRLVCLDADRESIAQESADNLNSEVSPDNLAYVIFTSGSTGQSKGVLVTHRSVVSAFAAWEEAYQLSTLRAHLQMASFSFDVFTGDLTRALCSGATLVLCPAEFLLEPEQLYRLMRSEGVDAAEFVPAVIRPLMEQLERTGERLDFMRLLVVGSDVWQMDEYQRLRHLCGPRTRVISSYGVTEATIDSTYFETAEAASDAVTVPIGRPFANTRIYLLDQHRQPVPVGVPGELYIGGAGLARGYLNRPELTAQKFIKWSVGRTTDQRQRLYRTGDLARHRRDGTVELLGRADQQIKLRGYRIEPGEIEATLLRHTAVKDAAVIVREDVPGDKRLVAYLVPKEQRPGAGELRRHLRGQLPEYMVPSAFVMLNSLPLTPNGKVDRRALPVPDASRPEPGAVYVAPRTAVEESVAQILAGLLRIGRVGVNDHFFELGGHSLLAIQVVSRIREAFGVEMPLRVIFEAPTVAGISAWITAAVSSGRLLKSAPLKAVPSHRISPQSFAQQRLWFLDQLDPGSGVYNLPSVVRATGPLSIPALTRSLGELIRRHEILRTTFSMNDDDPVQIVRPPFDLPVEVTDLTALPEAQREAEAMRLAGETALQPFDLSCGPLVRARLLRLSDEDHFLVTVFHHIISDGWSLGIFFRELGAIYQAVLKGSPAQLAELRIQYADYSVWQKQQLQGARLDEELAFWREQLSGAPARLELPTDHPRPPVQRYRGAQLSAQLSPQLSSELRALSQREGVTLFMTLLAAFQTLLHRYAQQEQILIGTPTAGRLALETEALIGFFVNTLVLRGDLSGEPTFRELLGRTRQRVLGALAHQELPFEKLVEELQPQRSLSYSPLFQVMFALQNAPVNGMEWGELKLNSVKLPGRTAKFDLSLDVFEEAVGLRLWLEYDLELFEAGTIRQMLADFETVLEAVTRDPQQRLSRLLPEKLSTACGRQPEPADSQPAEESELIAPRTPTEEIVVETYAGLLRLREVGVNEDFFELGGHSLLAARVIFRLRDLCGVQLSLRSIFETPTAAGLAAAIDEMLAAREQQELDELLAELESLSEDEAQQLLMEEVRQSSEPRWPGK